ncbi:MAG: DUF3152 domain-containing protein [Nocardioides sp.]
MRRGLVLLISAIMALTAWCAPAWATPNGTLVTPPVITGAATFREILTVTPGVWDTPPLAATYQWHRDGMPIAGATTSRYRLGLDDIGHVLTVVESVSDATGTFTAMATPTDPVARATFEVTRNPKVAGDFRFAQTLRIAVRGKVSPKADSVKVRWRRDGDVVSRKGRYRLGVEDVGAFVSLAVTFRRRGFVPLTLERGEVVQHRVGVRRRFTYSVQTRGRVRAGLATFKQQAQQTFDHPLGWRGAGFSFRRVPRGGDFTLVLSTAPMVPSFSSGCSSTWSCRVGRYVIINETRWLHASPAWNGARRSVRDYRHMVVNHETGHWLGHGHAYCRGRGPAPVMMQQSKGTGGCSFNPWPLPSERWARR